MLGTMNSQEEYYEKTLFMILSVVLCISNASITFANENGYVDTEKLESDTQVSIISLDDILIADEDFEKYCDYGESLVAELKDVACQEYDDLIMQFCEANTNPILEKVLETTSETNADDTLYLDSLEECNEKYELVYDLGNEQLLIVTPTAIIIDTLTIDEDEDGVSVASTTKSTSGTCSKTYYGAVAGNKLFSISVTCGFYYNGSKAWYKSGFDYYYTRGNLSLWQVSNWKGWKESSGTSYKAYCAGNFHWGIEYQGVGIVVEDYYCKNILVCSKSGTISRSASYS